MAAHLIRRFVHKTPIWLIKFVGNFWSPFLGAGIKIEEASADHRYMRVILKRSWYNSNYVGTQFGGSMYAMTDPFYMIMLVNLLGKSFIVWDKAAFIDFIKPGRTKLTAEFKISDELLEEIKEKTKLGEKYIFDLPVEIKDTEGLVIAKVTKTLYVRMKK